jgi:hypothetical protein
LFLHLFLEEEDPASPVPVKLRLPYTPANACFMPVGVANKASDKLWYLPQLHLKSTLTIAKGKANSK